jgi:hypothetical protein
MTPQEIQYAEMEFERVLTLMIQLAVSGEVTKTVEAKGILFGMYRRALEVHSA